MTFMQYMFMPEDSTSGVTEPVCPRISWTMRTAKTCLWVGMSILMSVGVSQLS